MNSFTRGMFYPIKGLRYLGTKGLKRYILLPILFNFILFAALFYFIHHYWLPYSDRYLNQLPSWLSFLHGVFFIVFLASFFLLFLSMFTVLFNVIAAPFNGLLAEKAQALFCHSHPPSSSFMSIAWRSVKRQGQFLMYFIPRFIGMCLLFFVPFIQPVYPMLWFLFNAWILSMQYHDFVMDNNLIDFKTMQEKLQQKRLLLLGFGSLINILSIVPLLNLIMMPAAVIGGVMSYQAEFKNKTRGTKIKKLE